MKACNLSGCLFWGLFLSVPFGFSSSTNQLIIDFSTYIFKDKFVDFQTGLDCYYVMYACTQTVGSSPVHYGC